jgi:hypothetical protein
MNISYLDITFIYFNIDYFLKTFVPFVSFTSFVIILFPPNHMYGRPTRLNHCLLLQ